MKKIAVLDTAPSQTLYHALTTAYDHFNRELFGESLPAVIFTVQRQKDLLGYFAPERWTSPDGDRCHEIAINPTHMGQSRVIEVLQTLVHEMVHCWQHCHGRPGRSSYHNKEWAYKMIAIGLQPSSTGEPGGDIIGQHMSDYPLDEGLFLAACHSLVKEKSFTLPWIYRMKARLADDSDQPTHNPLPSSPDSATHALTHSKDVTKIDHARLFEDRAPEAYLYATYSELLPDDTFYSPPLSKTKQKTTYQCPNCLTKVWGKPELNIACNDCNCLFIPTMKKPVSQT
jgi:hypothetical protein